MRRIWLCQTFLLLLLVTGVTGAALAESRTPSSNVIQNMATQQVPGIAGGRPLTAPQMQQPSPQQAAPAQTAQPAPKTQQQPRAAARTPQEYVLGTGDEIKLTVYGEEDLSGQYLVGSTGIVALPLIGNVQAARRTIYEFEEDLKSKLSEGYLKDPRVNVEVVNYRPFFILGEVTKPGSYAFVNGMTVLNAVALAGGYTYRADTGDIRIVHANDPKKTEQTIKEDAPVLPGDIVRVPERFF